MSAEQKESAVVQNDIAEVDLDATAPLIYVPVPEKPNVEKAMEAFKTAFREVSTLLDDLPTPNSLAALNSLYTGIVSINRAAQALVDIYALDVTRQEKVTIDTLIIPIGVSSQVAQSLRAASPFTLDHASYLRATATKEAQ